MPYNLLFSMILLELKSILMKKANYKKSKAVEIQLVFWICLSNSLSVNTST